MKMFLKGRGRRIRKILRWLFGIILVLAVVFHRLIIDTAKVAYGDYMTAAIADKLEYKEVSLTKEQMIEDLDYLYGAAVENTLTTEYAEKYYDVDYDQIYDTFKERILNCRDEYEFTSLLIALDAKLPGGHSAMSAPMDKPKTEFPMGELTNKETWEINYSLCRQFEDRMGEYDQKGAVAVYYDGDYVLQDYSFSNFDTIEGIDNSRLISLNGKPVSDVIRDVDTLHHWRYDESSDSVFVANIIFNDGIGEKYDAEIQLPDRTTVHKDLYVSPEYNMAYYYRSRLYPDHYKKSESDSDSEDQLSYTIESDPDRKLVYARFKSCKSEDTMQLKTDLRKALEDIDAENVILDFRNNGGGEFTYVTEGVLATVLDHDIVNINTAVASENKYAKAYYDNKFYGLLGSVRKSGGLYYLKEDFSVKGEADKPYNIYALVNHSTFSSGDVFAYLAKQDGITLIGQNTGGDGLSGNPLESYLPNSRLQFTFVCSKSEAYPEDCYAGVSPDYYVSMNWEDVLEVNEMFPDNESGEHSTYENKQKWDDCLIKALELIDENNG